MRTNEEFLNTRESNDLVTAFYNWLAELGVIASVTQDNDSGDVTLVLTATSAHDPEELIYAYIPMRDFEP